MEELAWDRGENSVHVLHEGFSDREFEVLPMIGAGKTISKITEEHHLSLATINTTLARILEKLNMKTAAPGLLLRQPLSVAAQTQRFP